MKKQLVTPEPISPGGYTISAVSRQTGLSQHVLRVWERRYGAVEPRRSAGGQRLYSEEELVRFRLLSKVTELGHAIGSVVRLSTPELERMWATSTQAKESKELQAGITDRPFSNDRAALDVGAIVTRALAAAAALDDARLDAELRSAMARFGLPLVLDEIVPALMHRIGDEWMAERLSISHEHLASSVVLALLLDAIRTLPRVSGAPRLLVATPAGEQHVIGAALFAATAAIEGWSILFLGADVPADDLASATHDGEAIAVALSIVVSLDDPRIVHEVKKTRVALPATVPLVVGGAAAVRLSGSLEMPGVTVCRDLLHARRMLASFAHPLSTPAAIAL